MLSSQSGNCSTRWRKDSTRLGILILRFWQVRFQGSPSTCKTAQLTRFSTEIRDRRSRMDKGIHIGSWGQLQEWKVDMDDPDDQHRHLSHLIGLYPGYAITNYDSSLQAPLSENSATYTKQEVLDAATISLAHRGDGRADGNAGWEKVWRSAAWAQVGNASAFYHQLTVRTSRMRHDLFNDESRCFLSL